MCPRAKIVATSFLAIAHSPAQAADLQVVYVQPAARTVSAAPDGPIVIQFDKPVKPESVVPMQSLWAFGRWSGAALGTLAFSNANKNVTLDASQPFQAGEQVMVVLSHDIEAADGTNLRPGGYSFQFWTRTNPSPMDFAQVGILSTVLPGESGSRAYGGFGSDLNGDRWPDITIVNEETADLRVFLNRATGLGDFHAMTQPTFEVGNQASPNEVSDFNRDGFIDVCVANISEGTVSVLLGNGDGTFAPQQKLTVGAAPRGIAVLDLDGDGDTDIAHTNYGSENVRLLLNDGAGVFTLGPTMDTGFLGEWALAAADMNNDGLLDLVVGAQISQQIVVLLSDGAGGLSFTSAQSSDGAVWMISTGDVNGDGNEDVAAVNSQNPRGAILLGNGDGTLDAPQRYATDSFPLATDLADLDGDGDLDWITSSYAGDWRIYLNNGAGAFAFHREFDAPDAASCSVALDFDRDGDLDLALIDEETDVVLLMRNSEPSAAPAVSTWGIIVLALVILIFGAMLIVRRQFLAEENEQMGTPEEDAADKHVESKANGAASAPRLSGR